MQDELTALGRSRWQALADEAAHERRARAIRPEAPGTQRLSARARRAVAGAVGAVVLVAVLAFNGAEVAGASDVGSGAGGARAAIGSEP